jgi:hypothetical protein
LFLHIPKTAGTSLREIVVARYPGSRCLQVYSHTPEAISKMHSRVREAEVVFGHFSFGFHELLGIDARYITMLREPVARVTSFFRHLARDPASAYHADIAAGMTLRDLLESERCHELNNHMVRIVSGHNEIAMTDDQALLVQAWANIDASFDVVGISERFRDSLGYIGRALGWKKTQAVPVLNTDPERSAFVVDAATRDAVMRFNRLDIELYRGAVARFDREAPRRFRVPWLSQRRS